MTIYASSDDSDAFVISFCKKDFVIDKEMTEMTHTIQKKLLMNSRTSFVVIVFCGGKKYRWCTSRQFMHHRTIRMCLSTIWIPPCLIFVRNTVWREDTRWPWLAWLFWGGTHFFRLVFLFCMTNVCMCIYAYIYVYILVYRYTYANVYIYIYTCIHINTNIYIFKYICICIYI